MANRLDFIAAATRGSHPLDDVQVKLRHHRQYAGDCEHCDEKEASKIGVLEREISFQSDLDAPQRSKLLEIAGKCPVHKTLTGEIPVTTELKSRDRKWPQDGGSDRKQWVRIMAVKTEKQILTGPRSSSTFVKINCVTNN